jgi:hypothetical protein
LPHVHFSSLPVDFSLVAGFLKIIMLFDFEIKENAECFVGYVSENVPLQEREVFFHLLRKYCIFINIGMPVHAQTGPEDSRKTRLPDSKTIGT